jgi:hypothetical protein
MNDQVESGVRAYKLDTTTPLDIKTCLKTFNDKAMYFKLLPKFETSGFLDNLKTISN